MNTDCPYCARADYLNAFTKGAPKIISVRLPFHIRNARFFFAAGREYNKTVTAEAERRGQKLRMPFYGKDLAPAWREFTIEVFGLESGVADSVFPSGDWGNMAQAPLLFSEADTGGGVNRQFFAFRVTHTKRPLTLTAHWWPTHGRLVDLRGPLSEDDPNADVELARKFFGFFWRETRGAPKITEAAIKDAIKRIGPRAQQKEVADELSVTAQGLINWRERNGLKTWRVVIKKYAE